MSWSFSVNASDLDQVVAAIAAAKEIIGSRSVGVGCKHHVTLSGHSNPDHMPRSGWANDCVTVSVSQVVD